MTFYIFLLDAKERKLPKASGSDGDQFARPISPVYVQFYNNK